MILEDNTVVPSYLGVESRGGFDNPGNQTNIALRVGEVKEIIYPNDTRSVNKRFIEYTVDVQGKDGSGPGTTTKYLGCVLINLFGSVADIFRFTLRSDSARQSPQDGFGIGAKVLLLCINGETTKAVIISGLRDTGTDKTGSGAQGMDFQADGHNLFFEFNGIRSTINDSGELQVLFRGKTKVNGKLDDSAQADAEGSNITFNKNGGIKIATANNSQFMFLDHQNTKTTIQADTEFDVMVNGNMKINSTGVLVGAATDAWMKGTTYRAAQSVKNTTSLALLNSLGALIAGAAASLTTAAGLLVVPVAGAIAAAVPIGAAASALAGAAPLFTALATAITTFEAQSAGFLSPTNKTD